MVKNLIKTKPQYSMPNKTPNHKSQKSFIGVWGLGLDWELGFGHWGFLLSELDLFMMI